MGHLRLHWVRYRVYSAGTTFLFYCHVRTPMFMIDVSIHLIPLAVERYSPYWIGGHVVGFVSFFSWLVYTRYVLSPYHCKSAYCFLGIPRFPLCGIAP